MTPDRVTRYERLFDKLRGRIAGYTLQRRWKAVEAMLDRLDRVREMWADDIVAARVREALAARSVAVVDDDDEDERDPSAIVFCRPVRFVAVASEKPAPAECLTPGCICNVRFAADGEPILEAVA